MRYLFVLTALLFFSCEDEANTPDGLLKEMNSIEAQINQLVSTDCASGTISRHQLIVPEAQSVDTS